MRLWIPFAVIGGLAAVVVLGVVVLLATRDVSTYKRLVEERVAAATGRGLAINGALELEPSFSPSITAADVTFANAAWGSRPEMVRLGRVEAQVELLPMLFGTVKIKRIVLQDADVLLETDASGRGNWIFGEPKEAGGEARGDDAAAREGPKEGAETAAAGRGEGESGEGLPLLVDEVRVEGLTLTYRDGRTGKSNAIALERLTGAQPEPGGPFELNVLAKLDGTEVEAQAVLGPALKDTPVTVTGTLVGARVEIQGTIAEPLAGEGLDLALRVQGDSLVDLGALADARLPAVGPYRLAARLTDQGRVYTLSDVEAELGESDITGTVKLAMAGERPRFEADLAANHLDLAAFSAEPGAEEEGDAEEAAVQPAGRTAPRRSACSATNPSASASFPRSTDGRRLRPRRWPSRS